MLLLVSRGDRKARIEIGAAYGSSRDRDAGRIVDNMVPFFRKGDYPGGIALGVTSILADFGPGQ